MELADYFINNPKVLDDENDLKAIFADYYKGDELKIRIMMTAYASGILLALVNQKTSDFDRDNQINVLVNQWGMQQEKAKEAINEWYRICPGTVVDAYKAYLEKKGNQGKKVIPIKVNKLKQASPIVKKVILAVCAFYLIIAVIFSLMRDTSVRKIEDALADADYTFVVSTYNERVYGNDKKENQINAQIESAIKSIEDKYLEKQSPYDEAEGNLDIMSKLKNEKLSEKANEAKAKIKRNENSSIALSEGIREYEQKNYPGAIDSLIKVTKASTSYDDARSKTEECADALAQSVLSGKNTEEYSEALDKIDSALKVFPDDSEIQKCRDDLQNEYEILIKDDAIAAAEKCMENGEYKSALETINQTLKKLKNNADLQEKKTAYENIIREKYLDNANACADSGDYAGALENIKDALSILSNDKVLLDKRKEFEPVPITELKSISDAPQTTERLTDNYKNNYDYALVYDKYMGRSGLTKLEYLIDSKFKHLEGTFYIPEGENDISTSSFVIKGDGFILYSSPLMNKISRPVAFNVDISGFDKLTIEWRVFGTSLTDHLDSCLGNVRLYYSGENQDNSKDYSALPIALTDLQSIYSKVFYNDRLTDNFGNTYNYAIYNLVDHSHSNNAPIFEYLLDSEFDRFECTLYVPSESTFDKEVEMIVTADGTEIYRSPRMNASSKPVEVKIDLAGCNDLKITFSACSWYNSSRDATLCLSNPYLYLSNS